LEDLSFRYLEEGAYKQIAQSLAERREDRERYIEQLVDSIQEILAGTADSFRFDLASQTYLLNLAKNAA
jgi:GTP pyrophosphokinase